MSSPLTPIVALVVSDLFMITVAMKFRFSPPKGSNHIYGYRTPLSMKNPDTWEEANTFSSKCLIVLIAILVTGQLIALPFFSFTEVFRFSIAYIVTTGFVILLFTEVRLHKYFNEDGTRKNT